MGPWRTRHGDRQANCSIKHPCRQFEPTSGSRTVHTTPQRAGQTLLDDLMNVNRQPKPGMPWVENLPALRHMGVLLSPSTTDGVPIRRSAGRRRTRRISARSRRLRQRQRNAMTEQACEFVDNRLRRCPPDRAGAVPYGQAGENALRFPHLAHRSAAAHKLHSATATSRIEFDSGKGETLQPATGLSLFFPEPVQTTGTTAEWTFLKHSNLT